MNYKFLTLFFFVFLLSFISVSALPTYPPQTVNEQFSFCQVCQDSTYITLSNIETPNATELINANMTSTGSGSFCYNYTATQVGQYDFTGISDGCLQTFAVGLEVTPDGKLYGTGDALMRMFVALFFVLMMFAFHRISLNVNYEKWYDKISKDYAIRNFVKFALAAILYNIMTNSYIVYFLLGLPIMLILVNFAFIYNITAIQLYIQALLYLYISMTIVLGVVFLSFAQEWFMDLIKMIQELDIGVYEK